MSESPDTAWLLEKGMAALEGKWKPKILAVLAANGTVRYGELRTALGNVSDAVLSSTLRDLCGDGMVKRVQYATMPPRVEYSLTKKGIDSIEILRAVIRWANSYEWDQEAPEKHLEACDFHSPV